MHNFNRSLGHHGVEEYSTGVMYKLILVVHAFYPGALLSSCRSSFGLYQFSQTGRIGCRCFRRLVILMAVAKVQPCRALIMDSIQDLFLSQIMGLTEPVICP